MAKVNVLILIHGMTLETIPSTHSPAYDVLWAGLKAREPALGQEIKKVITVEWGHELIRPGPDGLADDEQTTRAENFIHASSSYGEVRADPSPDNHLRQTPPWDLASHAARLITRPIKERVLMLGFTDAVYYCSPEGEEAVRRTVYGQVLSQLDEFRSADDVRLHVIASSLGATVAFDFLFGLFAPRSEEPDFIADEQGDEAAIERFSHWRQRAQLPDPTLSLGSKTTTGAQIPLLMMRKQAVVNMLARGQRLDPTVIGVPRTGPPKWSIFYDVDDILGFPTRRLFDAQGTIQEYEVDTGLNPIDAHGRYWTNGAVLAEIAKLIKRNL